MKFDAQTLVLIALVAFVLLREQKTKEPKPLLTDDQIATIAALAKAVVSLKGNVSELQKRIDDLHSVSTSGY